MPQGADACREDGAEHCLAVKPLAADVTSCMYHGQKMRGLTQRLGNDLRAAGWKSAPLRRAFCSCQAGETPTRDCASSIDTLVKAFAEELGVTLGAYVGAAWVPALTALRRLMLEMSRPEPAAQRMPRRMMQRPRMAARKFPRRVMMPSRIDDEDDEDDEDAELRLVVRHRRMLPGRPWRAPVRCFFPRHSRRPDFLDDEYDDMARRHTTGKRRWY
jgi:hypothetical protein